MNELRDINQNIKTKVLVDSQQGDNPQKVISALIVDLKNTSADIPLGKIYLERLGLTKVRRPSRKTGKTINSNSSSAESESESENNPGIKYVNKRQGGRNQTFARRNSLPRKIDNLDNKLNELSIQFSVEVSNEKQKSSCQQCQDQRNTFPAEIIDINQEAEDDVFAFL